MIKGEISGSAEVNEERHPDYKQQKKRGGPFFPFVRNARIYSTSKRQTGEITYFCERKQGAGLIQGEFSARKAPK